MDKVELRARLDFWQSALSKLRAAYLALVDGGVKSYVIDDRELTRFDLPDLKDEIEDAEKKVDELRAACFLFRKREAISIEQQERPPPRSRAAGEGVQRSRGQLDAAGSQGICSGQRRSQ